MKAKAHAAKSEQTNAHRTKAKREEAERAPPDATPDQLVPDTQVTVEFNINAMTVYRWDRDPRMIELGWPPRIKIRNHNFRSRNLLEAFKRNLHQQALQARTATLAKAGMSR
jgi:hypothetical protein